MDLKSALGSLVTAFEDADDLGEVSIQFEGQGRRRAAHEPCGYWEFDVNGRRLRLRVTGSEGDISRIDAAVAAITG